MQIKQVQSSQNRHYKRWVSLQSRRGIQKHSQCLVSGPKVVRELINKRPHLAVEFIFSKEIMHLVGNSLIPHYALPQNLFNKLDIFGTQAPLLIAKVPEIKHFSTQCPPVGLEVVCGLGDPQNVGALARCCHAFKARKLILLEEAAHPFHPKTIRSSSGSIFHIPLEKGPPINRLDFDVIALSCQGKKIESWKWPRNLRLLMGEEGQGLPPHLHATKIAISMAPGIDSLNAVSAASIALHNYSQSHP